MTSGTVSLCTAYLFPSPMTPCRRGSAAAHDSKQQRQRRPLPRLGTLHSVPHRPALSSMPIACLRTERDRRERERAKTRYGLEENAKYPAGGNPPGENAKSGRVDGEARERSSWVPGFLIDSRSLSSFRSFAPSRSLRVPLCGGTLSV